MLFLGMILEQTCLTLFSFQGGLVKGKTNWGFLGEERGAKKGSIGMKDIELYLYIYI